MRYTFGATYILWQGRLIAVLPSTITATAQSVPNAQVMVVW